MIRTLVTPLFIAMSLSGCVSTLESAVQSGDYEAVKQEIAKGGNIDGNYWTTIKEPMYRAIDIKLYRTPQSRKLLFEDKKKSRLGRLWI